MKLEDRKFDNFIITTTTFKSKMECFEHFKELIKKETFELINESTERVPLNKVNELIKEDYIYINIINEIDEIELEEGGCKNSFKKNGEIWIRDIYDVYEPAEELMDSFFDAEYVFLFIEENKEYRFLGLYKLISTNIDGYLKEWEKQDENIISLDEMELKKTIEKINDSYIEEYADDREKLEKMLKEHGERYAYLPDNLKNDEELCLISAESTNGFACKFAGEYLLNNREFAKKFLKKYPHSLKYFSDEIKNDFEICKNATISYRDMGKKIRKNRELALEILKKQAYDIKYIDKELRKDKEICEAYWNYVKENLNFAYYTNICSVIGIDAFGNEVIDTFLKIEKERHTEEIISQYEERTELVQFVKAEATIVYEESNPMISFLDKQIFNKDLEPLIVLIGEKENAISKQIKQEYQKNTLSDTISIIEIYKQNTSTYNPTLITEDTEKIIDLLRIITYDNNSKNALIIDGDLYQIKFLLKETRVENKIEIHKCKGNIKEIKQQINEITKKVQGKRYIVQLVYNNKIDTYTINAIYNTIDSLNEIYNIDYYSNHECNIKDIEIIIMMLDY